VRLPPNRIDDARRSLRLVLRVPRGRARIVTVEAGAPGFARVRVAGSAPSPGTAVALVDAVRHVLRLDEDLSPLYDVAARDPDLSWIRSGAGRLVRAPTVFEDAVKTLCTTNCAFTATTRMVSALVAHLGEPALGAHADDPLAKAFPTPAALAVAGEEVYRDVVRAGYRARYLRGLAEAVASGAVDLEALGGAGPAELPDDELAARLGALPGFGPYAVAHLMLLVGRYSLLVFDSWTRPTYARLVGRDQVSDQTVVRRFRRYGRWAGLAHWLFLTRWVQSPPSLSPVD
jgi:3-methyladenine DNA glycosylase/8-oxoguanine DNA glycosylase